MEIILKWIADDAIDIWWNQCAPYIALGLQDSDGESSAAHVLMAVKAKHTHLIAGVQPDGMVVGAMAVQFIGYPNYKVAHVYSIGGKNVITDSKNWGMVKEWMRSMGASKVQGSCKPAQARLWRALQFSTAYQIVRQDL